MPIGSRWASGSWEDGAWADGAWADRVTPPVPVVAKVDDVRRLGPSTVIYREGEISYWWERRQRVEDEEMIIL